MRAVALVVSRALPLFVARSANPRQRQSRRPVRKCQPGVAFDWERATIKVVLSGILGVPIEVDGENGLLPTTSIQPVGLIVNELVINAAKHGAGKVNVTYRCNGVRKITVCDEGSGLPPGFDPATNANGLGMKIANVLAKQLGGFFEAGSNPAGKGACFTVTFPG